MTKHIPTDRINTFDEDFEADDWGDDWVNEFTPDEREEHEKLMAYYSDLITQGRCNDYIYKATTQKPEGDYLKTTVIRDGVAIDYYLPA
jgi:hypothetical protein